MLSSHCSRSGQGAHASARLARSRAASSQGPGCSTLRRPVISRAGRRWIESQARSPRHRDHQVVAARRTAGTSATRWPHSATLTVACSPVGTSVTFCATMLRRSTGRRWFGRPVASPPLRSGTAGRRHPVAVTTRPPAALLGNHTRLDGRTVYGSAARRSMREHHCPESMATTDSQSRCGQRPPPRDGHRCPVSRDRRPAGPAASTTGAVTR